ncbi:MAG: AMP-dependent synthetase/ligase, partial [Thermodesulfobacteriota bacterium]
YPLRMKKLTRPNCKIPLVRQKKGIFTLQEMIEQSCKAYGDNLAYSITRESGIYKLSFNEVLKLVKKFAMHLHCLGLKKGDHIAILGENCPEWVISFFAVNWIGGVSIPLDAKAKSEELKFILNFSDTKAVISSNSFSEKLKSIKESVTKLELILEFKDIEKICEKYREGIEKSDSKPDDLCDILFTSGTTGNPKGVMLTNKNIMSNVEDMYSFLDISVGDTAFSVLPIHHAYERTCGILATFYSGVHLFFSRSVKPREMLEDLQNSKPTIWLNAPLILEKLYYRVNKELESQKGLKGLIIKILPKKIIGKKVRKTLGLEKIRFIFCGGAALSANISKGLKQFGFPVIQGYGLSETSPLISANPPSRPKNESVGMIVESDEVEIRNIDNDGNGEIWVKGPNIMKGYYKNEEATKEIFEGEWLDTGDVGYFDLSSYLYINGRKKNIIVTKGGKNIYPEEIEELLTKSRLIAEALVFSPDDSRVQAIIYPDFEEINFIYKKEFNLKNREGLLELIDGEIKNVNKGLQSYKRINYFAIRLEEFPKTTTRKIKRFCFNNIKLNDNRGFI